jgi:GAF domain-containing protein
MSVASPSADLDRLAAELAEARRHQAAVTAVFDVINGSAGNLAPVFAAVLEKATELCEFGFSILWTYDGEAFRAGAMHGVPPRYAEWLAERAIVPPPGTAGAFWQFVSGKDFFHNDDVAATPLDELTPRARGAVEFGGARTNMLVALRKGGRLLGAIEAYRTEVRPFSDKQVGLLRSFAAQAALAIENARLIAETSEALAQQTATAEVLQVINASPGELTPVFEAMLERAMRLCDASFGVLQTYDGIRFHTVVTRGVPRAFAEFRKRNPPAYGPGTGPRQLLAGASFVHTHDLKSGDLYARGDPNRRALVDLGGARTALIVALRKDDQVLGFITIYRTEVRPYADKHIALLESFAAQAVIAMENARLLGELRDRTRDLQEALEYQTATADVLKVMSQSAFELEPVLQIVCDTARRLCDVDMAGIWRPDGDAFRWTVGRGEDQAYKELQRALPIRPGRGSLVGRVALERRTVEIEDAWTDPEYEEQHAARVGVARSLLGVPLLREGELIGIIGLARHRIERFAPQHVELVETFADQAVIAIENVRLFGELQARTNDLQESLEYQTATSDVLRVMSGSAFDLAPVLKSLCETAARLCGAASAGIWRPDGEGFRRSIGIGDVPAYGAIEDALVLHPGRGTLVGRVALDRRTTHIVDAWSDPDYEAKDAARIGETRSMLGVPLLRDGNLVGIISLGRTRVEAFTRRQIELVETFADQAVIAIENARLLGELREARDAAEIALRDLKAAQASLIQAEKMASLGQLTAGIAHEIKNPLNFVNNFASLSNELLGELTEIAAPAFAALDAEKRAELEDTLGLLSGNLAKIGEHGKRADNIVKSMLAHSRTAGGDRQSVDVNGLVEESLNLAYHGARAQDQNFNVTLERDFDQAVKPIALVPQDVTRVFLNLFGNGFYAVAKRAKAGGGTFEPVVRVTTRDRGDAVEITVRDNGIGIPAAVRDRLFEPFFTTKPTGEGTGLGLSISYDIVTKQHGGTIAVESEEGAFTQFTVRLPRARAG